MKYINTYKLHESTDIGSDQFIESIEDCKDIIETFNDGEDKFKIVSYKSRSIDNTLNKFFIEFHLVFRDSSTNWSTYSAISGDIVNVEKIDDIAKKINELISRSKFLVQRLSKYCQKINYTIYGKSIRFYLYFSSTESLNKN
jgi:hypothetical protein